MAQFTNRATVSYSGGEAASNIVTGEITQALSVTKTAAQECYRQGELITYAVGLRNTGSALLGGLTLTDNLGEYAFGEGMLVPLAYAGSALLCERRAQTRSHRHCGTASCDNRN